MTELLRRWVNDEIKLSRSVKSFDADFCNGHMFGEVLSRNGLLDPQVLATKFTNDQTPGCKLGNFTQVRCAGAHPAHLCFLVLLWIAANVIFNFFK